MYVCAYMNVLYNSFNIAMGSAARYQAFAVYYFSPEELVPEKWTNPSRAVIFQPRHCRPYCWRVYYNTIASYVCVEACYTCTHTYKNMLPAPPWCTTASTCLNSQECGHGPTRKAHFTALLSSIRISAHPCVMYACIYSAATTHCCLWVRRLQNLPQLRKSRLSMKPRPPVV